MSDDEPPEGFDAEALELLRGLNPDLAPKPRATPVVTSDESGDADAADGPQSASKGGLDPDAAVIARRGGRPAPVPVVIDTRKYQWMVGALGLTLVVIFCIYLAARGGNGTPGFAPGSRMHNFVAPLATSHYNNIPANAKPKCNPAKPNPQGLNVCGHEATVLALFATGAKPCVRQIDAMNQIAPQFPHVLFGAVAVNASRSSTLALVRAHHWTIPVAYDTTGIVGQVYGVEICPMLELAKVGGVVQQRLLGEKWETAAALSAAVQKLADS